MKNKIAAKININKDNIKLESIPRSDFNVGLNRFEYVLINFDFEIKDLNKAKPELFDEVLISIDKIEYAKCTISSIKTGFNAKYGKIIGSIEVTSHDERLIKMVKNEK